MTDHTHQFTPLRTRDGTELLAPCRICRVPASEILARVALERDARLGQVYDLLDVVSAILTRPKPSPDRSTRNIRRSTRRSRRPQRQRRQQAD